MGSFGDAGLPPMKETGASDVTWHVNVLYR